MRNAKLRIYLVRRKLKNEQFSIFSKTQQSNLFIKQIRTQ